MKKLVSVLIISVFCLTAACGSVPETRGDNDALRVAVLLYGDSVSAENAYDGLKYSMAATLEADMLDASEADDLSGYSVLYLDGSIVSSGLDKQKIQDYVSRGGSVFLDNSLYDFFDKDFIGAEDFTPLYSCPSGLEFPEAENDLQRIQDLIWDFDTLYQNYTDYGLLSQQDYGVGVIPSTAVSIASKNDVGIYTMNEYGGGYVFFTNPMLPNNFSVNNLSERDKGEPLAMTTVGANRLLRDYFAEFVSVKKYGYAVEHVLGSFASPVAARQLYIDDIKSLTDDSFDELNAVFTRYGQIPSVLLPRSLCHTGRRAESVTYVLGGDGGFFADAYENIYSSGAHFVSNGEWLSLGYDDGTGGYYEDNPDLTKRAYPCPIDWNGDGCMDLICGSADGKLYYFEGTGMDTNYTLASAQTLTDTNGNPLSVGAYSSPAAADVDLDGVPEIITGDENGSIHCFKSTGGLSFENQGIINETGLTDAMPSIGDLDGDNIPDMAVGSRNGDLRIYYGKQGVYSVLFDEYTDIDSGTDRCAPCIADADNDGVSELYAGTPDGYIAKYENNTLSGYLEGNECNHSGNTRLKFGANAVPRFYDIDGDGRQDLIIGALEYGMAVPIDSAYFPYQNELKTLLGSLKEQYIYIGAHTMSHAHADPFHDMRELEYHKNAFRAYGLEWDGIGADQVGGFVSEVGYNTHYDNRAGYNGAYKSQYDAGLLWNSRSRTPASAASVGMCAENSIILPFYLKNGTLLLESCNLPRGSSIYANITAKYGLPLLFSGGIDGDVDSVIKTDRLVNDFSYSFAREDQLVKMTAAALNTVVYAKRTDNTITLSRSEKDAGGPLCDKRYQNSTGVKIILSDEDMAEEYSVDANVYYKKDGCIFLSLDKSASISKDGMNSGMHIIQVNLPAKISKTGNGAKVKFADDGVMTVTVDGMATTASRGWDITQQDGTTTFRKYGKAQTLKIVK